MKRIKAFFSHPVTISLLGVLLLSLLIWFGGPYIKFGEDNVAPLGGSTARLLAILVLLVLWGLNNLRLQWQDRKQNSALVDDIKDSHQAGAQDYAGSQASDEVHQIQQRFTDALSTLRQRRFRGAANKNRALYELPWYIIVGPPGAGKTTALVNSGLEFPLADKFGKGALQGIGGTRNCDWWFTNDAVLVDTAGRYTTQDSHRVVDSSAWEGFLALLKKHRRRRPINGVIVSVSVQDLLTQTEEERLRHARTIRTRIDELMAKLEVRFPVYLMFTKADLISGFNEFFEDLGKEERDQVWGLTLPRASQPDEAPDFEYIGRELQNLEARLYDRVLWRMHQERDGARRSAIEQFPKQVEQVNALAQSFVQQTFAANRYRYQPFLRGVYFSSGTQDGTPIDRLMSAVSAQFGFAREAMETGLNRGKSFFLGRLFQDVIFPESELVGTNPRYERWRRWGRRTAYGALAASVVGLLTVWTGSVGRHAGYMEDVRGHLSDFEAASQPDHWRGGARATLAPLTALAQASSVYDQEAHPWLSGVGLYDGRIDERADAAYHQYLRGPFSQALLRELETALLDTDEDLALYNHFRVYQMFGDVERLEPERVINWFAGHWERNPALAGNEQAQLKQHLADLLALDLNNQPLNQSLSRRTAQRLLQVPVAQRVYNRIQDKPEYQRPVDLRAQYGDQLTTVFEHGPALREASQIPWMFTREGYKTIDLSSRSPVLRELVNDRWIFASLDESAQELSEEDLGELSERVTALYLDDYIRAWSHALQSLEVKPFSSLNQGSDVLARAADPLYSPLYSVLQVSAQQTRLTNPKMKEAVGGAGRSRRADMATDLIASTMDSTRVDKHFSEIHRLMGGDSGQAPIHVVLDELRKLSDFLQDIRMAPNPDQRAFEIARERFAAGAGNPATSLRGYARNLPQPLEQWLTTLSQETWRVILISARSHVTKEWQIQVYQPYQRMAAGRYPLVAGADAEMSLYDFSEFFKPGGMHQRFFEQYVAPFVNTRGQWSNRSVDGYSLGLSPSALTRLRQGMEITEVMFQDGEATPSLTLEFKPRLLSKENARFSADMGGEVLSYNHGPKFWRSVEWSGNRAENRLRLQFEGLNGGRRDRTYTGPWAWLRALDEADVDKTPRADVFHLTFAVVSAERRDEMVYEVKTRSVDNLFNNNPLRQYRCPEVL
ncbi:type VI secretion system membrane subunit TssM [Marinimicrobium agarilyticum]|uniref:type VI secretion system membrane subunit TssM n=1 Tax=Marinimicrobium agarilyticum TaxID=306546 RepID=UPI00040F95E3|nr:type VI secretion system membrane subunit TssM [Marinimicrobium agarilyticum]